MFCMLHSFRVSTVSAYTKPECLTTQNPWSVLEAAKCACEFQKVWK